MDRVGNQIVTDECEIVDTGNFVRKRRSEWNNRIRIRSPYGKTRPGKIKEKVGRKLAILIDRYNIKLVWRKASYVLK